MFSVQARRVEHGRESDGSAHRCGHQPLRRQRRGEQNLTGSKGFQGSGVPQPPLRYTSDGLSNRLDHLRG